MVAIYLRGDRLNPSDVSEILGIEPSRFQKKGELKSGSEKYVAKLGLWMLKAQTNSTSISDQIGELLEKLKMLQTRLDQIEGVEEASLDIFIPMDKEVQNSQTVHVKLD